MAKKEKWITYPGEDTAEIEKFSTDPLKFGIEILEWFSEDSGEWEKVYKQDNSKRIKDCIEDVTGGKIEYDRYDAMFLEKDYGMYIKAC